MVVSLDNLDGTVVQVFADENPTGTLDTSQRSVGDLDQVFEGAVLSNDGLGESGRFIWQLTTTDGLWGQAFPVQAVVGVTTAMELDILLQFDALSKVACCLGRSVLFQGLVDTVDVGLVVLGVVQGVQVRRDEWFQFGELVLQFW